MSRSDEEIKRFNENFTLFHETLLRNTDEVIDLKHEEKKNRETNEKNIQFMQKLVNDMMDDKKDDKAIKKDVVKMRWKRYANTSKKRYATLWKVLDWSYKVGITLLCLFLGVKTVFF